MRNSCILGQTMRRRVRWCCSRRTRLCAFDERAHLWLHPGSVKRVRRPLVPATRMNIVSAQQ
eukprot:6314551-Alexandrium_andersonii.AAC.1